MNSLGWLNDSSNTKLGASRVRARPHLAEVRGPGYVNFDFTLAKNFSVTERIRMQFRTEFFNAFNRANFGPPNIARDSTGFGQILSASNARIIQFGLKLSF